MSATMTVRHPVQDYAAWRAVYDGAEVAALHSKHGVTNAPVGRNPEDGNDIQVTHDFDSVDAAQNFAGDPDLAAAMEKAGVAGAPEIAVFELA
jgi:hypothetical protein